MVHARLAEEIRGFVRCLEALAAELEPALGRDARLDGLVASLKNKLHRSEGVESEARSIAQGIALAVQGALLVRFAPDFVANAFCASRLSMDAPFGGGAFGALPGDTQFVSLLARAWPAQ